MDKGGAEFRSRGGRTLYGKVMISKHGRSATGGSSDGTSRKGEEGGIRKKKTAYTEGVRQDSCCEVRTIS